MPSLIIRCLICLSYLSAFLPAEEPNWKQTATRANWWKKPRDYNMKYHPWSPPVTLQEWEIERKKIRTQLLVSQGLWPLPEKSALKPVIHGKQEFSDYTIEKVFFESCPGLYVTGSLYRPVGTTGQVPGILSPHGHWEGGRFYQADDATVVQQIATGAESFPAAATSPIQARMVHLARMGCVVFHYDMIGYADHQFLDHRTAFSSVEDGLWLIESMGLQTWNSIRALDFLLSLPDVDASRIAITGASGGGTQSFMLAAIDERIKVSLPAVMVSTDMQGGCVCENAPYLRIGLNNVSLAALAAPRAQGLIGADDWTIRLSSRGFPELRQIYQLYGQPELIQHWVYPQFGHNYNQVSRQRMYEWLQEQLPIPHDVVQEQDFELQSPEQLTVFDEQHPRPVNAATPEQLRARWRAEAEKQRNQLTTKGEIRPVYEAAAAVILGGMAPTAAEIQCDLQSDQDENPAPQRYLLSRKKQGEVIPLEVWPADESNKHVLFLFDLQGTDICRNPANAESLRQQFAAPQATIVTADIRGAGVNIPADDQPHRTVNTMYYGYTSCYEIPYLSAQVQDLLMVIVGMQTQLKPEHVTLVGSGQLGLPTLLTQGVNPHSPHKLIADLQQFRFADITDLQHPFFLPGALKYGGSGGLASIFPAEKIVLYGADKTLNEELIMLERVAQLLERKPGSLELSYDAAP